MIRRRGQGPEEEESSSDEDDAFAVLSKKDPKKVNVGSSANNTNSKSSVPKESLEESRSLRLPISKSSSMKRHHKPSEARKANMDALIEELEAEKNQIPNKSNRFVPEKKGSFVEPGQEYLTTNLFVGNLAPSLTEEDLSNLFSQFGELYSVKIMWPRTMEERNRRRNTGFVCFMNRDDAEEALEACDETDTFNNGRQLMMRWGKNVKKVRRETKIDEPKKKELIEKLNEVSTTNSSPGSLPQDFSAGGLTGRSIAINSFERQDQALGYQAFQAKPYDPEIHASRAIRVEIPTDQSRFHFISTTASYVSKDPELEQILKDTEMKNSLFNFLTLDCVDDNDWKEKMFYRWRVYSFCQGETHSIWRTEPFIMFSHESARYWIPPPMDMEAVNREKANAKEREDRLRQQKEDRANRELMTGRQFEREFSRKRRGEFGAKDSKLNPDELSQFDQIVRKELSISRETICRAMAFCFDKCFAAQDVSGLLMQVLLDESDSVTNDMRIARLYLLSDVLFNSQQPGVRNAFMYRSTIESLASEIFRKLGVVVKSKERSSGRITVNKLRKAVSAVLGAWTEWGVFDAAFMDELEAHFNGREVKNYNKDKNEIDVGAIDSEEEQNEVVEEEEEEEIVCHEARGDWKEVSNEADDDHDENNTGEKIVVAMAATKKSDIPEKNKKRRKKNPTAVNEPGILPISNNEDIDGKCASSDVDEAAFDGEALDGEALDSIDGDDIDGEDLDGDDIDGEDLDGEAFDGDAFDSDEMT